MERKFIQSVLFLTAILAAYAFVSPPAHLSAQSAPLIDPKVHVRKGVVESIDSTAQNLVVDFGGVSILVVTTASTTISSPDGDDVKLDFFRDGTGVYVFGFYDSSQQAIIAEKIVMRNESVLERKTLSRAQMEDMNSSTPSILDALRLTAK